MFGCVLGILWLNLIEDGLQDEAAALIQELSQVFLEMESGKRGDRPTEKPANQGADALAQVKAGLARRVEAEFELLDNSAGQEEGRNRRLCHGGCLSLEGCRGRVVPGDTVFLVKSTSFFQSLTNDPNSEKLLQLHLFPWSRPEWHNRTRLCRRECNRSRSTVARARSSS